MQDIAWVAEELMRRGADIVELNAVRKRLSAVKGGKLLRRIGTRRVVSLIISDVVGTGWTPSPPAPRPQTRPPGNMPPPNAWQTVA